MSLPLFKMDIGDYGRKWLEWQEIVKILQLGPIQI